jgi:hypothetical protein
VPVFADPDDHASTNWNSDDGTEYGYVYDPPPTSVAVDGHAVCLTGFVGDPTEVLGGFFIFRNSWGTSAWAASAPTPGYATPEPGYGMISASYVDRWAWEYAIL